MVGGSGRSGRRSTASGWEGECGRIRLSIAVGDGGAAWFGRVPESDLCMTTTLNPLRVLIVEDEAVVADGLVQALGRGGYESAGVCGSGGEALRLAQRELPDVVLMDIQLSGAMDGIEAALRMQRDLGLPVVFLTGHTEARTVQRARAVQPYGYLLKPFHESELHSVVELAVSRHAADRRLRESEERYAGALRSMAGAVICTDVMGTVTFINATAEALTGWRAVEALGRPLREVFRVALPGGEALKGAGLVQPTEAGALRTIFLTSRDGRTLAIEDNTNPIRDASGALTGIVILFRQKSGVPVPEPGMLPDAGGGTPWANLAGIIGSIADPLLVLDADWRMTYLNVPAASLLEGEGEELLGQVFWDLLPASLHRLYYHEFAATLEKKKPRSFEMHHEQRGVWHEVQLYPYREGLLTQFRDITARKAKEQEEEKMEKLESLGLLARGFAHEFNNVLTVLLGNLALAKLSLPEGGAGRMELDRAHEASMQAQGLVQQLMTFARGGVPIRQLVDAGVVVREWFADWTKRSDIEYRIDAGEGAWPASLDRQQIRRVLSNLVKNAEQATMPGDAISVRLTRLGGAGAAAGDLGLPEDADPGGWLVLEVSDNGSGIQAELVGRVFEPYFTTKAEANASGLGLTVCESVARGHGGKIRVISSAGEGTSVRMALPAVAVGESVVVVEREPVRVVEKLARRVLVLEDEPLIRHLISQHLGMLGCETVETADGNETVARYREAMESGRRFDLVIFDLSIPGGMGGAAAMELIRKLDPGVCAIVSSGYSDDPVMSRYQDFGFRAVLPKPYEPSALREMAGRLLVGGGS